MRRASQLFTDAERQTVDQAVAKAESNTSAEIIPVVATASGRYDRAEDIIGMWLATAATIALWIWLPRWSAGAGDWGGLSLWQQILILVAAIVVAFVVGALIGSRIGWLRRLFTPRAEMRDEVAARAREIFFDNRVHHTAGGTGLLLYVSLFEHMAAVIGDRQIVEKLGQAAIDQLCSELTEGLHAGGPTEALRKTLLDAGKRLSAVLPRAADDVNELADSLVTID